MSLRQYSLIMFSGKLAELSKEEQKRAVRDLEHYIRGAGETVWKPKKASDDTFDLFYSGKIYLYEQYAVSAGIAFQPEVVRASLSEAEKHDVEQMGFKVCALTV